MSALLGYSDYKKLVRISLGIPNHYRKLGAGGQRFYLSPWYKEQRYKDTGKDSNFKFKIFGLKSQGRYDG